MATRTILPISLLLLAACGDVDPLGAGSLRVHWQVSPSGCADAGVEAVEVRALGPANVVERFECRSGEARLDDLAPGSYRLELFGFDADGVATFVSEPWAQQVEADRDSETPTLRLLAAPAVVDVRWVFENGRVCGANGAQRVAIGVFDEFDYEIETADFACDAGEGRMPPLRAGSYLIEVNATDRGSITWRGTSALKVARADTRIVDVTLAPAE